MPKNYQIKKIEIKKKFVYITLKDGCILKHPKNLTDLIVELRQDVALRNKYPLELNEIEYAKSN